ncbi:putative transcriptional regulator [Arachis hypogaea]|nr:putative transcriptional regulator [Arachis hypogaea]
MGICNQDTIKQLQSMMENVNEQQKITFQDAWQCDICGSKSERGFEATFEVLPRLNDIKFGSGVIDELLFWSCHANKDFLVLKFWKATRVILSYLFSFHLLQMSKLKAYP